MQTEMEAMMDLRDREAIHKNIRMLIPIDKSAPPQRITYGVVLEPDTEDLQGDVMTAEDIEKAAYDWMERSQTAGHMHSETIGGAKVVESFIAPCDIPVETADGPETIRKGSWVLGVRWPENIWKRVADGELTGYSVGGTGVRLALENVDKAGKWAPGPNAGWRRLDDPASEGAAAEGGGTPADRGAAAARREGEERRPGTYDPDLVAQMEKERNSVRLANYMDAVENEEVAYKAYLAAKQEVDRQAYYATNPEGEEIYDPERVTKSLTAMARDAFDQVLKSVGQAHAEVEEEAGDGQETD